MRCLMCGRRIDPAGSWQELIQEEDLLCHDCRTQWLRRRGSFRIDGVRAHAVYEYGEAFSRCLIQYKECGDEALKDVFLYPVRHQLHRRYRGWTLLLMPSAPEKEQLRGFHTLPQIFACLDLPMMEPFEKAGGAEQKRLGRAGRMGMSHGIRLKPGIVLPERCLLADDVITTGSTIRGALACMQRDHRRIEILACACVAQGRKRKAAGTP